jgi:hypothetical protein
LVPDWLPFTCCFKIGDDLSTITRRGEMGTSVPVFGLRPTRCFFLRTRNDPKDESLTRRLVREVSPHRRPWSPAGASAGTDNAPLSPLNVGLSRSFGETSGWDARSELEVMFASGHFSDHRAVQTDARFAATADISGEAAQVRFGPTTGRFLQRERCATAGEMGFPAREFLMGTETNST